MKLLLITLAASLFLLFTGANAFAQKSDTGQTFIGEIVNRQCISQNHMTTRAEVNEANECTKRSASHSAVYVLYDPESKTTYELVDQNKAAEFAGQQVMLTGYVDISSRAVQISDIVPHS